MRYKVFWSAFSVFCLSLCLMVTSFFLPLKGNAQVIVPKDREIKTEVKKEEKEPEYEYLIKEDSGKLSVYKNGEKKPIETFNVYIKTLPLYDQQELEDGIQVKNYEELLTLIEDYIS